jgi:hypothetical protein
MAFVRKSEPSFGLPGPTGIETVEKEAPHMAGKSIKNKRKYRALKRKGMSKSRAARISNAGKSASRKGGKKKGG